jgi:hypothetical protein
MLREATMSSMEEGRDHFSLGLSINTRQSAK